MITKRLSLPFAVFAGLAASGALAQKPAVSDAQIAQIVVTANSIDIANGDRDQAVQDRERR
jgi:hypothetical protein